MSGFIIKNVVVVIIHVIINKINHYHYLLHLQMLAKMKSVGGEKEKKCGPASFLAYLELPKKEFVQGRRAANLRKK